jgi:DNA-binding response OmpR family regulator
MSHILLISANERLALRLQIALLRRDIMSEVASTFRRGLAIIQARPPAAIVLDGAIPELDDARLASLTAPAGSPATIPVLVLAPDGRAAPHDEGPPAPEAPLFELLRQQGIVHDA